MVSRYAAEALRDNVAARMADLDLSDLDLERAARLDDGHVRRLLAANRDAWPCPTSLHRLATALHTTTEHLLSDGF